MAQDKIERGSTSLALKAGFWYVFSTFVTKGLAFITTPIFARLMTKADYGEFTNYASWQSMLIIIVSVELYNTLSRAYYDFTDEYDDYASSIAIGGGVVTVACYFLFLACGAWIYKIVNIPPEFTHLMFFAMFCQTFKQVFLTRERTLYRYKSVAVLSILSLGVPTLLSIFAVVLVDEADRLAARMYGFYVPYALIGVYCAWAIFRKSRCFKWKHMRYALVLALPLLTHYLTTYLLTSTNTIITKSVLGAESAAIVSVVGSIMNILTVLFQAITGAVTTWMMDNLEQGKHQEVRKCGIIFAAFAGVVAIGIMLLGKEMIWIFGGSKYADVIALLPGMTFAMFLQMITTFFTIILTYDKNVVKTAIVTLFAGAAGIVAKIVFLKSMGWEILPLINIIAFAVTFIANYFIVRSAGYGRDVDIKGISLIVLAVLACMLASPFLYSHMIIRYAVTLVIGGATLLLLYKTRNRWIPVIRKAKKA